jgi:hypothetical protein
MGWTRLSFMREAILLRQERGRRMDLGLSLNHPQSPEGKK